MTSKNAWMSDSTAYLKPRTAGQEDAWTAEAASHGSVGTQRLLLLEWLVPPAWIGNALGLAADEEALCRRRLILRDGQPVEIAESWYPRAVAQGTRLADPRRIPGGAPTLLAQLGHPATAVTEDIESRGADDTERELLHLGEQDPVLVLTRLIRTHRDRPTEASVMITPGRERRLRYEMRVT